MAKKRRKKPFKKRRDVQSITRTRSALRMQPIPTIPDDQRLFHPLGQARKPRSINNTVATISPSPDDRTLDKVRFNSPALVSICRRRTSRREVLFAKKKTGSAGQRKPRYTQYSQISCKG